jgi:triacylglycerol lipase
VRTRRRLLTAGALLVAVAGAVAVLWADAPAAPSRLQAAPQDQPGPVLLVPGYGGSTAALEELAAAVRATGRAATVVPLTGAGTGDLRESAQVLDAAADVALAGGAPSVDVIGYSAGGLVARLWARESPRDVRRVITLGSPHHGTEIASLGAAFDPGSCPAACLQLVPGSDLLDDLNDGDETPNGPRWLSLWTAQDTVVTPPESARLDGATNVELQDLCPGLQVSHAQLPTAPVVRSLVLQAISFRELTAPAACPA